MGSRPVELLLEVRSAEMPERLQRPLVERLAGRLFEELMSRGLGPAEVLTARTPRRATVCLRGLPERQPDRVEEELGPPMAEAYDDAGEPTEALRGFAERLDVAVDALRPMRTERGEYVAALREIPGRTVAEALADVVAMVLAEMASPSAAFTVDGEPAWPRPVTGLLALVEGTALPVAVDGVAAGTTTIGHPWRAPETIEVGGWEGYLAVLADLGIEPRFEHRRRALAAALADAAAEEDGEATLEPTLLDRLTASCETPGVVVGRFAPAFLELPEEILIAALGDRLDAVPIRRDGILRARFLAVMDRLDDPASRVRTGRETAVAGCLSDARFRYRNDCRTPLAERATKLDGLAFHRGLGSLGDKQRRVAALLEAMTTELGLEVTDREALLEAAALLKADLTTDLVADYPGLRGTYGGLLARGEGFVEPAWQAIADQYRPAGIDGELPRGTAGRLAAFADRLDSLVGWVGREPLPTGSKDPLALRRLALGLLRLLVEGGLELDLDLYAARAVRLYGDRLETGAEDIIRALRGFLGGRLRYLLGQRGLPRDAIDAALAVAANRLPEAAERAAALAAARDGAAFRPLVLAARRIVHILGDAAEAEVAEELLSEPAEAALWEALSEVRPIVRGAVAARRWDDALNAMGGLVEPLDRFFSEVLVMDEDPSRRDNRLALLDVCRRVLSKVGRLHEMTVHETPDGEGEG